MGYYLNSSQAFSLYKSEAESPYFVDKSLLLRKLFPLVKAGNKHICITRPRRFGKSIMAAMIAAFFSREMDSSCIFDTLKIAGKTEKISDNTVGIAESREDQYDYREFMNQYNVIYINFLNSANMYAATTMQLTTRNELLSAMVVYGFLNYEDGKVEVLKGLG